MSNETQVTVSAAIQSLRDQALTEATRAHEAYATGLANISSEKAAYETARDIAIAAGVPEADVPGFVARVPRSERATRAQQILDLLKSKGPMTAAEIKESFGRSAKSDANVGTTLLSLHKTKKLLSKDSATKKYSVNDSPAAPKKRGRKPKVAVEGAAVEAPKKRGRKPKNESAETKAAKQPRLSKNGKPLGRPKKVATEEVAAPVAEVSADSLQS